MSPRLWCHRISDILEAIEKIRLYVASIDFEAFREDPKTIDAVIRNFIIIGEAAGNVPGRIMERHPTIPWRLMSYSETSRFMSIGVSNFAPSGKPYTKIFPHLFHYLNASSRKTKG